MAKEIEVSISISVEKGGVSMTRAQSFKPTMTGDAMIHAVQEIPTGGEVLAESDALGAPGWVYVKNLDSNNYVTLGSHQTDNHTVKLLPGESTAFRCVTAIFAKANTASLNVEYMVIEL
tara:strand:- start:837 stop:1193 length:357 start_codon:yes stop_codon:yes gene_type:complete